MPSSVIFANRLGPIRPRTSIAAQVTRLVKANRGNILSPICLPGFMRSLAKTPSPDNRGQRASTRRMSSRKNHHLILTRLLSH